MSWSALSLESKIYCYRQAVEVPQDLFILPSEAGFDHFIHMRFVLIAAPPTPQNVSAAVR